MSITISGIDPAPFRPFFDLDDAELAARSVRRFVVDATPGFACRVTLEDAAPGERVLLLNYVHQPADSPYRASHAIDGRENAVATASVVDAGPAALAGRTLSLRAFDDAGMMVAADLAEARDLRPKAERLLGLEGIAYVHVHYAMRGCYAARVTRTLATAVPDRTDVPCAGPMKS